VGSIRAFVMLFGAITAEDRRDYVDVVSHGVREDAHGVDPILSDRPCEAYAQNRSVFANSNSQFKLTIKLSAASSTSLAVDLQALTVLVFVQESGHVEPTVPRVTPLLPRPLDLERHIREFRRHVLSGPFFGGYRVLFGASKHDWLPPLYIIVPEFLQNRQQRAE